MGYAHLAFLGQGSLTSAAASECAAEQGKFWAYHDYIFEEWNLGNYTKDNLKVAAENLELDSAAFDECLDSGRTEELVFQDTNMARQAGVRSTPTFFVNGQRLNGALPYSEIKSIIESHLQ